MITVSLYAVGTSVYAGELPSGGRVIDGDAHVYRQGSTLNIDQTTDKAIIDWKSFSVGKDNTVNFNQPSSDSATLNRVTGDLTSQIAGQINSNGSVFLVNPNGILITKDGGIDTGNFVASTLDIDNNDFLNGDYTFTNSGSNGVVANRGTVAVDDGGFVALLGGAVKNDGFVRAHVGKVGFASGEKIVMSFGNNDFLRVEVPTDKWEDLKDADGNKVSATLDLGGTIDSRGGFIDITVADASDILRQTISIDGVISANTVSSQDGVISISGGTLGITSNGRITADADYGDAGRIDVAVQSLNMSASISATAATGNGGTIKVSLQQGASLSRGAVFDVSGKGGGSISLIGGLSGDKYYKVVGTGDFIADGSDGTGGYIDISSKSGLVGLFSGSISAKGAVEGGRIRIGGAFQGGRYNPETSSLDKKTQHVFVDRWSDNSGLASAGKTSLGTGVRIDASSASGMGGTVILWADHTTNNYAQITATGNSGGAVEISAKKKVDSFGLKRVEAGDGVILLDPKNVVISKFSDGFSQAKRIMSTTPFAGLKLNLNDNDNFGTSVAISKDGSKLAVGARFDDTGATDNGAVYLFTVDGKGSSWGRSLSQVYKIAYGSGVNVKQRNAQFGKSVAFNADGTRLAVGMPYVDKSSKVAPGSGRVLLFSVDDSVWGRSVTRTTTIESGGDGYFGTSVALSDDASKLAIGESHDNGGQPDDASYVHNAGSVSLFTLSGNSKNWGDEAYTRGRMVSFPEGDSYVIRYVAGDKIYSYRTFVGRIVHGTGGLTLSSYDSFGYSVALSANGSKLAVGAEGTSNRRGAVHLFTLSGAAWGKSIKHTAEITDGTVVSSAAGDITLNFNKNDFFGGSVALSDDGSKLAVGAIYDDTAGQNLGAVYLFTISGSTWGETISQNRRITHGAGVSLSDVDKFGYSVALNADGSQLVVGAVDDDSGGNKRGAVYLLRLSGNSWGSAVATQRLITHQNPLNLKAGGAFGSAVALSDDGTKLAVGATQYNNKGAVYLFEVNTLTKAWGTDVLYTRVIADGNGVTLSGGDTFGSAVALSDDGTRLVVGASGTHSGKGAVYAFTIGGSRWGRAVTQTNKLVTATAGLSLSTGDNFGSAVALNSSGSRLAVGASGDDTGANNAGAVYIFTVGGSTWGRTVTQSHKINGGSGVSLSANGNFGSAVAFDGVGTRLAVGASGDGAGVVYLFVVDTATVTNTAKIADGVQLSLNTGDAFGSSLSLSHDGNRLAVGAYGSDANTGAVYMLRVDEGSSAWGGDVAYITKIADGAGVSLQKGDSFGTGVVLRGDGTKLVVGAKGDNTSGSNAGTIYTFTVTEGGAWSGKGTKTGKNIVDKLSVTSHDAFGSSVALSKDGKYLAVGAVGDETGGNNTGAVYLFSVDGATAGDDATWGSTLSQKTKIVHGVAGLVLSPHDGFGSALALSADGSKLAVGAALDNSGNTDAGAVYLFSIEGSDSTWGSTVRQTKKIADGAAGLTLAADDEFGSAVALSADGGKLAVGAKGDNTGGSAYEGAVYLFSIGGNTWGSTVRQAKKIAHGSDGLTLAKDDVFGGSVALSADGGKLAVGAYWDNTGGDNTGAVYLFTVAGATWGGKVTQTKKLADGVDGLSLVQAGRFGSSVALSADGSKLTVGAIGSDSIKSAVYLFTLNTGANWGGTIPEPQNIIGSTGDKFGSAVALSGDGLKLVVGASADDSNGYNAGTVYTYTVSNDKGWGTTVTQTNKAVATNDIAVAISQVNKVFKRQNLSLTRNEGFGRSVALSGDGTKMAVGAEFNDTGGTNRGAVYLFELNGGAHFGDNVYYTAKIAHGNKVSLQDIDRFGSGVALNHDGSRLVVGVSHDDTNGENYGAAYLFRVGGSQWGSDLRQLSKISSKTNGHFGTSVAISGDGKKVAIGVPYDDTKAYHRGVVKLYTIADNDSFRLSATYGHGDRVGSSQTLSIQYGEQFGQSVALSGDGSKLAVGALGRSGYKGRVYLFSIGTTDAGWGKSLSLQNTIGDGAGVALSHYDYFGASVSLSDDGAKLAVGAWGEDAPNRWNTGAVYVFDVGSTTWGSTVVSLLKIHDGSGVSLRYSNTRFGFAVALTGDGNNLVVGAPRANGKKYDNEGALYVFDLAESDSDVASIKRKLAYGTDIKIVASNDITINDDIITTAGTGKLTLIAGRSIIINGDVKVNGGLTLKANDASDNSFALNDRDSGKAQITVTSGKTLSGGGGDVLIKMLTGKGGAAANKTQTGKITVWKVDGKRVSIVHLATADANNDAEIVIRNGGQITATGDHNKGAVVIELASQKFTNTSDRYALKIDDRHGDKGRFLIWAKSPADVTLNGISDDFSDYNKTYDAGKGDFQSNTTASTGNKKEKSYVLYRASSSSGNSRSSLSYSGDSSHTQRTSTPNNGGGSGAVAGVALLGAGAVLLGGGGAPTTAGGFDAPIGGTDTIFTTGIYAHLRGVDMQAIYQPTLKPLRASVFDTVQPAQPHYKVKYTTTYDMPLLAYNIKSQKVLPLYEMDERLYETLRSIFVWQSASTHKTVAVATNGTAPV